jgi:hypothetical protein
VYIFTNRFAKTGPVRGADKIFEKEVDPALLREPPDFVTLSREGARKAEDLWDALFSLHQLPNHRCEDELHREGHLAAGADNGVRSRHEGLRHYGQ